MRIPLSWLHEYLGQGISCEQIEEACTDLGIEVDAVEPITLDFEGVLVGTVEKIEPLSEKLKIIEVSTQKDRFRVVTSAQNCYLGMHLPIAPLGTTVKNRTIEHVSFSGVLSEGMLLSEHELGLGDDESGILELPSTFQSGTLLASHTSDTILHLSFTPNLGHCLSVWGLARELSPKLNISLKKDWKQAPTNLIDLKNALSSYFQTQNSQQPWQIDLTSDDLCFRYSLLSLHGIPAKRSPYVWRRRLTLSGFRPIHLVVDALNLVMLEVGQPMHAFDTTAFCDQHHVIVRKARQSDQPTPLALLGDQELQLQEGTLIIANSNDTPLAIGGVIGGKESAVCDSTENVVIESAYFSMTAVRKSRKNASLSTESSRRFERGVDPEGSLRALYILFDMLKKECPSIVIQAVHSQETTNLPSYKKIQLRFSRIAKVLGFQTSRTDIEQVFTKLSYSWQWVESDVLEIIVPSYRHDVDSEVDLIEDIAKILGFSNFDLTATPKCHITTLPHHPLYEYEKRARQALISLGLQECVTSSLISPTDVACVLDRPIPTNALVCVQNPMSVDQSILRPSLLPGLIHVLKRNVSFKQTSLCLFELGSFFLKTEGKIQERLSLGILLYGDTNPYSALRTSQKCDFYDLKGIWQGISHFLKIQNVFLTESHIPLYHPGRQAALTLREEPVGFLGELHPKIASEFDFPERVYFLEVDLQHLMEESQHVFITAEPLKLYPSMERDWTVLVPKSLPYKEFLHALKHASPEIVEKIDLISLFSNEKMDPMFHNVTIRITFRHLLRTLEQAEVDAVFQEITEKTLQELSVKL